MIEEDDSYSGSYASRNANLRTLDRICGNAAMSVYCECGRIVILDRSEMKLRLSLGKELECMTCRNARISREIDALNAHFNGVDEADCELF